jgi:cellulose synthase operon protein C
VNISAALRSFIFFFIVIAFLLAACSFDPNVRKQKYLDQGESYLEKGKYPEASIEFLNAVKIDRNDANAHYQLAKGYVKLQQWPKAYDEFKRTIELQPENYPARVDLAKLLIASGSLQQAQEQTDLLLQRRPNDSQTHFIVGNLLAAEANYPAAIAEMRKAIAINSSDGDSYLNLALLQMKAGQPDSAEANFKKAVELNPKDTGARSMLGDFYQFHNRPAEAEQQFRSAIEIDPQNPDLRAALARLYIAEGKNAEAEGFLKQVKVDFPNNSVGYRMLGDFYFKTGALDKATTEYGSLYQEHPKDLEVKKNFIQLLIFRNRLNEARSLNEQILKSNPNDNDGLLYAGEIQIRDGHGSDAVVDLQKLTKNDATNAVAHYQLGVALEESGDQESAEREWREAVRLRPDLTDAQRSLALLAMRKGDMTTLEQAATQLMTLQSGVPEGYSLRAVAEINRKQFAAAEEDIHKAIDIGPQSQLGYVEMGNLKFVQKQYEDATQAYQDALDRDANSSDALRGLMNTYIAQKQADRAVAVAEAQIAKSPSNGDFYDLLGTAFSQHA